MAGATAGAGIASTFLSTTRGGYNALADTVSVRAGVKLVDESCCVFFLYFFLVGLTVVAVRWLRDFLLSWLGGYDGARETLIGLTERERRDCI